MKFSESLKKNREFRKVYQNGRFFTGKYLTMHVMKNDSELNFLGIVVSKKVGNSVVRHKVKRRIKECYRLHEERFNSGFDIVIVAKAKSTEASYQDMEKNLLRLTKLHGMLNENIANSGH